MTSGRVVCIGLATLDAIALVPRLPVAGERLLADEVRLAGGGVAATAAVTLARLGVPVALVGRVADDEVGHLIRAGLEHEGVDVSGLATVPGSSPLSVVLVETDGERTLLPYLTGVAPIQLTARELELCREAAWLHVDQSGYPALAQARAAGIQTSVSLDAGNPIDGLDLANVSLYAPTERALLDRYPGMDLAAAMQEALGEGPEAVVVTRGDAGSIAAEQTGDGPPRISVGAAFEASVVSTLGAGDVFHGAILAALVDGFDIPAALRRANAAAALACGALDGRSAIPTRAELDAFLDTARTIPEVTHAR